MIHYPLLNTTRFFLWRWSESNDWLGSSFPSFFKSVPSLGWPCIESLNEFVLFCVDEVNRIPSSCSWVSMRRSFGFSSAFIIRPPFLSSDPMNKLWLILWDSLASAWRWSRTASAGIYIQKMGQQKTAECGEDRNQCQVTICCGKWLKEKIKQRP